MAMKKYMLVRKTGKGEWLTIFLEDDQRVLRKGGKTSDKAKAEAARDRLKRDCPGEKYAVVEVED